MDIAIKWLAGLPSSNLVADFGCGDARLMKTVNQVGGVRCVSPAFHSSVLVSLSELFRIPVVFNDIFIFHSQKVHSFDLVASAPGVVACNMADVPLGDASVDVAVFSLALMGTDYGSFIVEAHRVSCPPVNVEEFADRWEGRVGLSHMST